MNVVLVAEESAGVRVLRALVDSPHRVTAVLTSGSTGGFRGAGVADVAAHHHIPVQPATLVRDPAWADRLRADGVDLLLNVHSLYVIGAAAVAAPRIGAFNLHPGPLPECAGLNAPSWAIYHREPQHGVTVHWMTAGVDEGAIAYEERFPIGADETGLTLSATCIRRGVALIERLLGDAAAGGRAAIPATPQDVARRRYFGRAAPQGGRIDWARPAADIAAFVRACDFGPLPSPWGAPTAVLAGADAEVRRARATTQPANAAPGTVTAFEDGVAAAAADAWVLLDEVWRAGRRVPVGDLLAA